jgi:sulfite dehydrogenase (cytochrome) subunit B
MRQGIFATGMLLCLASAALAAEDDIKLADGPGLDAVQGNCAACHSLDYIKMNSPFADAKLWDAEVTKMIKAYGAPIDAAEAKAITEYLVQYYGKR